MITADTIQTLTSLTALDLTRGIRQTGYKRDKFDSAKFLGLTNACEFCYTVSYVYDGEEQTAKVFVRHNAERDSFSVDY